MSGCDTPLPPQAYRPIAAAIAMGVAQIRLSFLSRVGDRRCPSTWRCVEVGMASAKSVAAQFDRTM